MEGFLRIHKPQDWTSHDVVQYLRRVTGIKKIGHAGTLDPFATGLLIVGIGRSATKHIDQWKQYTKTYTTTIHLGATSDTYDSTGAIIPALNVTIPTIEQVEKTLTTYIGTQPQIPPMYSAKKVQGKKLYDLARAGIIIERSPCTITIHHIILTAYNYPFLHLTCTVSTGTYIRTLAHDIGQSLGTGGYCDTLERVAIGPYTNQDAPEPKDITKENWETYIQTQQVIIGN